MKKILLLLIILGLGCTKNSDTEKFQNARNQIKHVQERIKEIKIENVLIGSIARLYTIDNYLLIVDYKSSDYLIHIFDRKNFNYITSTAIRGQGPGEIANIGHLGINEVARKFYLSDHGKQRIFSYEIDSVLINSSYMPEEKLKLNAHQFPDRYLYINDTLSIGIIIEPIGNSGFNQSTAKWNLLTGNIKPMKYKHPEIEKKRITFAASIEHGSYIECYTNYDLMTILNFNGDVKYNIYGPKWDNKKSNSIHHYDKVIFVKDKIIASYSGGNQLTDEYFPTKFFIFDLNGDYIRTLEIGYSIPDFCYDERNNRIIMNINDEIQFAYLDLDGLIQ